jgi:CRP/FNR family cyclic AMP-dependent transcriptional regulator
LRVQPLLAAAPEPALEELSRAALRRHVSRKTCVVRAGERSEFLYLVLSGRLAVLASDRQGREVILSVLGAGEFFGETTALDDTAHSATVTAVAPSNLILIGKSDFNRLLRESFDTRWYVMRKLVQRLRLADRRIESLALHDVSARVVNLLWDMAEPMDGERVVGGRLCRQEIAKMVGASREMVGRVVRGLCVRGLIEETEAGIVLHENGPWNP